MERKMRRFRQELPENETLRILETGKVAVLALDGDNGYPYSVPVNYVYSEGYLYIHSARQGHKIDAIRRNPLCSACIIEKDDIVPEQFTSYFRSIIIFGKAEFVDDRDEIIHILKLLSHKYSPGIDPTDEIKRFIDTVCVIRIKIEHATGKEAIELTRLRNHPETNPS